MVGAVACFMSNPVDTDLGIFYYRLFCAGVAGHVAVFLMCAWMILSRFVKLVEAIRANAERTGGGNSFQVSNKRIDDMREISVRFRFGRNMLVLAAPLGVGAWIVQAIVLPVFWYIVLLQFFNTMGVCWAVWLSVISVERKKRILRKLQRKASSAFAAGGIGLSAQVESKGGPLVLSNNLNTASQHSG